jgi:hypothetical protein
VTHGILNRLSRFDWRRNGRTQRGSVVWALLAVLLLFPKIDLYPAPDADSSWKAGLVLAHTTGLRFGRDVVFTYGPLGFLGHPMLWGTRSLLAVLATLVTLSGLVLVGTRALACRVPVALAALLAGLTVRVGWRYEPSIVTPLVFTFLGATLWHLLARRSPTVGRCVMSGAVAALLLLTKVDTVTYSAVALGALVLSGETRPKFADVLRRCAYVVASLVSVFVLGWLVLGQSLSDIGIWLVDSLRVAVGFNENMVYRAPPFAPWVAVVAALVFGVLFAVVIWRRAGDGRGGAGGGAGAGGDAGFVWTAVLATLFLTGTMWMAAKSGFVRFDGHGYRFFWFLVFMAVVLLCAPDAPSSTASRRLDSAESDRRKQYVRIDLAAAVALLGVVVFAGIPGGIGSLFRGDGPRSIARSVEPLLSGARRAEITATGTKRILEWAKLSEAEIELLRGKRVHADSEDIALIWALGNQVTWKPNPVMQSTNAYTPELDERNASGYRESKRGPEMVIYHAIPGDGHHPRFQSPAAVVALICNFVPTVAPTSFSQVLARSENRCGAEGRRAVVRGRLGQRLTWKPEPGDDGMIVVGRVVLDRQLLERASATLRVRPRSWTFQLGEFDNNSVYRFDIGTAAQPHLLSIPACLRPSLSRFDTRTYDSLLIDQDDGAPRIDVALEVTRIPYRCP